MNQLHLHARNVYTLVKLVHPLHIVFPAKLDILPPQINVKIAQYLLILLIQLFVYHVPLNVLVATIINYALHVCKDTISMGMNVSVIQQFAYKMVIILLAGSVKYAQAPVKNV